MTIVVPVKNRATLVLRTLASIKEQTWRPLRVIVVDNGSTDGTPESVNSWSEKNREEDFEVTLLFESVPGPSAARNCGLQEVDSRLMMFFDSDDLMHPEHVEEVMRRFHAGDDPDLVCFRVKYHPINGEDRVSKAAKGGLMVKHICHTLLRTQGFACETALVRRAGAWDNDLHCWEDLELGARMLIEARNRVYIDKVNVDVYARADSVTGAEFSSNRGEWEKALDKMERSFEASRHKDRWKWIRVIAYKRAILAAAYNKEKNREYGDFLLNKALENPTLNRLQRLYIRLSYRLASVGIGGTNVLVNQIF